MYKKNKIIDFFKYDIPYGVKSLYRWFKIIWKDRNWDHQYIYEILRHKLYWQERHIRLHDIHSNAHKNAKRIKTCYLLLDRLIKDEYYENAFYFHDKKWGESDFGWKPYNDNHVMLNITRPNIFTKEDEEQEAKEYKRLSKHESMLREQDLDMLFKIMRKHIQTWWD